MIKKSNLKTSLIFISLIFLLAVPQTVQAALDGIIITNRLFLTAPSGFYEDAIQKILEEINSPLAEYQEPVGGTTLSAADTIWLSSQHMDFGLSPKTLLVTLFVEGNLDQTPQTRFTPYVQDMAEKLWANYSDYLTGSRTFTLNNGQEVQIPSNSNAATYALAKYFAPNFESEDALYTQLTTWQEAYRRIFNQDPTIELATVKAAPDIQPFLRLPFDQPDNGFLRVNSFFDHAVPGVYDDSILRFDGQTIGTASFNSCIIGVNCYGGHNGIDYKTGAGRAIYAAADGTVVYKYYNTNEDEGRVDSGLYIDHGNGYRTTYWHMDPILVESGETVVAGQLVGLSGNIGMSSGPHLHFGLRITEGNKSVDPYGWWNNSVSDYWGDSVWMWQGDLISDNYEAQSQLFYVDYWWLEERGYNGSSYWTYGMADANNSTNWGMWGAYIPTAGIYDVYAYWPSGSENTNGAQYSIFHSGGTSTVTVNQSSDGDRFVLIGTYNFDRGDTAVLLRDVTNDAGKRLYFDAIKWEPVNVSSSTSTPTPTRTVTAQPTTPDPNASYIDNTNTGISYSGNWALYNDGAAYNGSYTYSSTIGNSAQYTFNGTGISLLFTGLQNRGTFKAYIDGQLHAVINEYSDSTVYQKRWDSGVLTSGQHTLKLVHSSGSIVDIDALIVKNETSYLSPGTYDETNIALRYTGQWWVNINSVFYNSTLHYSFDTGNKIAFDFYGTQFSILYTGYTNRGIYNVYIDGQNVGTINEYNATEVRQKRWDGPTVSEGRHSVVLEHASGPIVDLDAVIITGSGTAPTSTFTPTPTLTRTPTATQTRTPTLTTTATPSKTPTTQPANANTYDDTYSGIAYSGTWGTYSDSRAYNSGYHYSNTIGSSAEFTFNGTRISLLFTGLQNRGTFKAYIDGQLHAVINEYSDSTVFQKRWDSGVLTSGQHTLKLVHSSGSIVDIDALIVQNETSYLSPGTYDETNIALQYTGQWWVNINSVFYNSTLHYSFDTGNKIAFDFYGTQFSILYTGFTNRGIYNVYIDGQNVGTINEYNATEVRQKRWDGPTVSEGRHSVVLQHASGMIVDLDAVIITGSGTAPTSTFTPTPTPTSTTTRTATQTTTQVVNTNTPTPTATLTRTVTATVTRTPTNTATTQPANANTYDDIYSGIAYSGTWGTYSDSNAYNSGYHYSNTIGSSAEFTFNGTRVSLLFTGLQNRGTLKAYIDGQLHAVINEYSDSTVYQKRWDSGVLTSGQHTLKLVHSSGSIVDIDALIVQNETSYLSPGTYDETNIALQYTGQWWVNINSVFYNSTLHYSFDTGNKIAFDFYGTQFSILYTGYTNRGIYNVYIDGQNVGTINEYNATEVRQKRWDGPAVSEGRHSVVLQHASGMIVDLDAVIITGSSSFTPTPTRTPTATQIAGPVPAGTYNDSDSNILYSGSWITQSEYSATEGGYHYSDQSGSSAELTFSGSQVSLLYSTSSNMGNLRILIDNTEVVILSQYSSSTTWQSRWDSSVLSNGTHTLRIENQNGTRVNLDEIIVSDFEPEASYRIQQDNPFYLANFAHPESGDNWMGVGGQVFDANGNPVTYVVVVVEGTLNGQDIEELSLTSISQTYGPGGFEIVLSSTPTASSGTLNITLYDLDGTQLSTPFYFDTYADPTKNLILINFQKIN